MGKTNTEIYRGVRIVPLRRDNESGLVMATIARSSDTGTVKFVGGKVEEDSDGGITVEYLAEARRELREETGLEIEPERLVSLGVYEEIATGSPRIKAGTIMLNAWYLFWQAEGDELVADDDVGELMIVSLSEILEMLTYNSTRVVYRSSILPKIERFVRQST